MSTRLPLLSIRTDGGTQPRATMDYPTIEDYTDAMAEGIQFPPVVVFYDGTNYWLADGFHRLEAAFGAELKEIECDVHQGTQQAAQWYSFAANKTNGLRRTNEDKQRAVKAALAHPKAARQSDRAIAKHLGVAHATVSEWRRKIGRLSDSDSQKKRTGLDGRTTNTANIGTSKSDKRGDDAPAPPAAPVPVAPAPVAPAPVAPAPVAPAPPTPPEAIPVIDPKTQLARYDCTRLLRACNEVAGCNAPAKDVAAVIRHAENRNDIVKQLEVTLEYIAETIRETAC